MFVACDDHSVRRGELITRKSWNENALIASCSELLCVQVVPADKVRVTYALRDLPLANAAGIRPVCVQREFNPRLPTWPNDVLPPLVQGTEPRDRNELESMLRWANEMNNEADGGKNAIFIDVEPLPEVIDAENVIENGGEQIAGQLNEVMVEPMLDDEHEGMS